MSHSYIIAGCRTPIGKMLGGLSTLAAPQLGAIAAAEAVRRAGVSSNEIDDVIMGNVLSAGLGQAPARQVALRAGLPATVSALTINKMCGSGLQAVMLADQAIRAGDAQCVLAGGIENMSRAPHLLLDTRRGWKFGAQSAVDSMIQDGLWCAFENVSMGAEADYISHKCGVSRAAQDEWSVESHRRAVAAATAGKFQREIVPVKIPSRGGETIVDRDEGPRADATLAALAKLPLAFEQIAGVERSVTAGNASQISDGAAALIVVDEPRAKQHASPWCARIVASATSGVDPKDIFLAPVAAIEMVLAKARLTLADIDLIELNEAFAAQVLACAAPLGLDLAKTNVHGGAIALGHPIGASGARVLVTLMHALVERGLQRGLAALCLGGGNAVAMIIERCGV